MSRPLRPALPLLVAALSAACAGRGTARPSGTAENFTYPLHGYRLYRLR